MIIHPASYRDPSGFIFYQNGALYRQINESYREHFELLHGSGLYDALVGDQLLIPHEQIDVATIEPLEGTPAAYAIIRPEPVAFLSYAWEWSFSMLQEAALATLRIMRTALDHGMVLKDASTTNMQWHRGKMVLIDTLSFIRFETRPWIAYRQFCEQFLAPLLIQHYLRKQMPGLALAYPEGVPVHMAASMLPFRSRFNLHTYLHIHLQAKIAKKPAKTRAERPFSKAQLTRLIDSLDLLIRKLNTPEPSGSWAGYYEEAAQRDNYLATKQELISNWLPSSLGSVLDAGANEGVFSRMLADKSAYVVAADFDADCIDRLYRSVKTDAILNLQPMVLDLANPSPATGVGNRERDSFKMRADFSLITALAVIHHLCVGKNIPFDRIAAFFSEIGEQLIIEFVPKTDEKVRMMLKGKADIYDWYTESAFFAAFAEYYSIEKKAPIGSSGRTMYLMHRK